MLRRTHCGVQFRNGDQWRTLKDPHGPPSDRQLRRLNREGRLRIVDASGRTTSNGLGTEPDSGLTWTVTSATIWSTDGSAALAAFPAAKSAILGPPGCLPGRVATPGRERFRGD